MDQPIAAIAPRSEAVTAMLTYSVETGARPISWSYGPRNIYTRLDGIFEDRAVSIVNGRPFASGLSLDRNGFVLLKHATTITDFFDRKKLDLTYGPELEQLVVQVTGASRAVVYDLVVRSGDEKECAERMLREPRRCVHNDYTMASGAARMRELLPDLVPGGAASLLDHRLAIINVWRPIRTVRADPLAIVDARTVHPDDVILAEHRYPDEAGDGYRAGESYRVKFNPAHRWFYFPAMQPDEVLVFKIFDSATDGRARFAPHAAFRDPTAPADAPHRQSIEARLFAFFDDKSVHQG